MNSFKFFYNLLLILSICFLNACSFGYEFEDLEEITIQKKFTGNKTTYYPNGNVLSIVHYKRDKKDSISTNFYENGKIHLEIHYKNNKRDGVYKWFYTDGSVYQERHYKNNKLEGPFIEFYKSGKVKFIKKYAWGEEIND